MSKGDLAKERILSEATRLVQRKGVEATSVGDLLRAAGVTKGGLYHHFPGKDDLGLALLERARVQFLGFLKGALTGPTPWAQLTSFFSSALAAHRGAKFVGGCLWGNAALEMSDKNPRYVVLVAAMFDEWMALIEEVVHKGQRVGEIRGDLSASDLAQCIVATIEGGIMLSRLTKTEGPLKTCLDALKAFLRGPTGQRSRGVGDSFMEGDA